MPEPTVDATGADYIRPWPRCDIPTMSAAGMPKNGMDIDDQGETFPGKSKWIEGTSSLGETKSMEGTSFPGKTKLRENPPKPIMLAM
jgi:hypothetical protein